MRWQPAFNQRRADAVVPPLGCDRDRDDASDIAFASAHEDGDDRVANTCDDIGRRRPQISNNFAQFDVNGVDASGSFNKTNNVGHIVGF
jgi:hypothetical protein